MAFWQPKISCPVYGFYGGNDQRITVTVPKTVEAMNAAGHGFMRAGEAPEASEANKKARDDAFKRWLELLKKI